MLYVFPGSCSEVCAFQVHTLARVMSKVCIVLDRTHASTGNVSPDDGIVSILLTGSFVGCTKLRMLRNIRVSLERAGYADRLLVTLKMSLECEQRPESPRAELLVFREMIDRHAVW
jgi:hypothetical protein